MGETHQIGEVAVDVRADAVVAIIARRPEGSSFLRGVRDLDGIVLGNRVTFPIANRDRVLDFLRTHFGMEDDVHGLARARPTIFVRSASDDAAVLIAREAELTRRADTLRRRAEAAERMRDDCRRMIARIHGGSA